MGEMEGKGGDFDPQSKNSSHSPVYTDEKLMCFPATVTSETFDEVYADVKHFIGSQPRSYVWIPSKDKL